MNYLKVSIMIPTYNRAEMLRKCLESCLVQTYPNLEIIVSDNASPDNTRDVMKEYLKDERVKYYRQDKNIFGEQWKRLLYEYAQGDYGILLPDDDYLINKDHVAEAMHLIHRHRVNYVLSNCYFFDYDKGINKRIETKWPEILLSKWAVRNIGRILNDHCPFFPGLSAVFNLEKARELKAFIPTIYGLDYEIGIKFMLSGDSAYLRGQQRMAIGHSGNDSRANSLDVAMDGSKLIDRAYLYGLTIGHNKAELKKMRKRCAIVFLSAFVSNIWYRDNGTTIKSIIKYYNYLRTNKFIHMNSFECLRVILRRSSILVYLRYRNKILYLFLRKIYRNINIFNRNVEVS
jgi:glycosyltransferase involved in cell wall biosynthesis